MVYEEFPPTPSLAPFVRCAWTFEASRAEAIESPQRIVPDGRCEMVVHLGDAFLESGPDGVRHLQPRVLFAGQLSRPLWLHASGRAQVIGIRFHAAGARRFLGLPLSDATDKRIDLESLWPENVRRLVRDLRRSPQDAVACALRFVAARIDTNPDGDDPPVARCAAWLEREQGRVSIEDLVDASTLGRRQLERRFRETVGLSPRLFANVLRLRSVFDAVDANPDAGWTEAALAAGYFDQSHLIRDFRRFVGCTPAQFVASKPGLATALV